MPSAASSASGWPPGHGACHRVRTSRITSYNVCYTKLLRLLLQRHEKVSEILDRCALPDLEILQILKVLLDKQLVEVRKVSAPKRTTGPLLSSEEIMAIKERLGDRDVLLEEASAKLVVLASEGQQLKEFLAALSGFPEFKPDPGFRASDAVIALA